MLNAALKAAAELPESWRKLFEKLRPYDSILPSSELQVEVIHRWLDSVYGVKSWRVDYNEMHIKTLQNTSLFEFREEQSGNCHRVLVVGRELAVLPPASQSSEPAFRHSIPQSSESNRSTPLPVASQSPVIDQCARVDLAVITVLPEEYQAVVACLDIHQHVRGSAASPNIYSWEMGTVGAGNLNYTVVVALAGEPTNQVGAIVTRATIERFNPRYVVLVGIAGGLAADGQEHGDVVISKSIYGYEYGKVSGGFQPRPNFSHRADQGIMNAASAFIAAGSNWWIGIKAVPPRAKQRVGARLGDVASGNKVVDDVDDSFFAAVLRAWPKLLAVEMEGAGAAIAIEAAQAMGRQVGFAMIRAISDMPGTRVGTAERDAWKPYAAEAAARFLFAVLRTRWPVPPLTKLDDKADTQVAQLALQQQAIEQQQEALKQQRDAFEAQARHQRNSSLREAELAKGAIPPNSAAASGSASQFRIDAILAGLSSAIASERTAMMNTIESALMRRVPASAEVIEALELVALNRQASFRDRSQSIQIMRSYTGVRQRAMKALVTEYASDPTSTVAPEMYDSGQVFHLLTDSVAAMDVLVSSFGEMVQVPDLVIRDALIAMAQHLRQRPAAVGPIRAEHWKTFALTQKARFPQQAATVMILIDG